MRIQSFLGMAAAVAASMLLTRCDTAQAPGEGAPAPTTAADEAAIQKLADDFAAAWQRGDAVAVADLFSEDGDTMVPSGRFAGREEIRRYYQESFTGMFKDTSLAVTTTTIRFLEPDVALVNGTFEINGLKDAAGVAVEPMKGFYSNVAVKSGGAWRIVSARPMIPVKLPGTT